jgi:hypothetical protein
MTNAAPSGGVLVLVRRITALPRRNAAQGPRLHAADQPSIVVLNLADAPVEVTQRRLPPSSIPLLAIGLKRVAVGSDILTGLQISAIRRSVPVVPISVVLSVIVAIALLVGLPAVLSPAVFVLCLIPAG